MLGKKRVEGRRSRDGKNRATFPGSTSLQARTTKKRVCRLRAADVGGLSYASKAHDPARLVSFDDCGASMSQSSLLTVSAALSSGRRRSMALPHGECGLDVIALIGQLRYREHRSISEIHEQLKARQVIVCERTVEHLLHRYDELVSLHLQNKERLFTRMQEAGTSALGHRWAPTRCRS